MGTLAEICLYAAHVCSESELRALVQEIGTVLASSHEPETIEIEATEATEWSAS